MDKQHAVCASWEFVNCGHYLLGNEEIREAWPTHSHTHTDHKPVLEIKTLPKSPKCMLYMYGPYE